MEKERVEIVCLCDDIKERVYIESKESAILSQRVQ